MSPSGNTKSLRTPKDLGALIRRVRQRKELNQAELAEQAGVGRRFLIELEEGKPTAQIGKAMRVLAALGVSLLGIEE